MYPQWDSVEEKKPLSLRRSIEELVALNGIIQALV